MKNEVNYMQAINFSNLFHTRRDEPKCESRPHFNLVNLVNM